VYRQIIPVRYVSDAACERDAIGCGPAAVSEVFCVSSLPKKFYIIDILYMYVFDLQKDCYTMLSATC